MNDVGEPRLLRILADHRHGHSEWQGIPFFESRYTFVAFTLLRRNGVVEKTIAFGVREGQVCVSGSTTYCSIAVNSLPSWTPASLSVIQVSLIWCPSHQPQYAPALNDLSYVARALRAILLLCLGMILVGYRWVENLWVLSFCLHLELTWLAVHSNYLWGLHLKTLRMTWF